MRTTYQQNIQRLQRIQSAGVNPWPAVRVERTVLSEISSNYQSLENQQVTVAGRIISRREHGSIAFLDLRDESEKLQVALRRNDIGQQEYQFLEDLSVGDFISVIGRLGRTQSGEITVFADSYQLLSVALRHIPRSLSSVENRYRQRYLDFLVNDNVRQRFVTRSRIISSIRQFLDSHGLLEVETPELQPIYGGANARPFTTHHNALNMDLYLRISNELYLKRLIIGGFDGVYEFARDFRNEGVDQTHNPEFTQLEIYQAYADYTDMMRLTEELYSHVVQKVLGSTIFTYQSHEINVAPPWRRITMSESLREYAGVDVYELNIRQLRVLCRKNNIDIANLTRGLMIAELFETLVEHQLVQPTFITDFPRETTSLCQLHRDNPELIERFEPYVAGLEIGNAYTELNNPVLQRQFFEEQARRQQEGDEEAHPMDEDFLLAMEYGMPPTGGLGLGIDRMVMLLTNQTSIREVITFPLMRSRKTRKIRARSSTGRAASS